MTATSSALGLSSAFGIKVMLHSPDVIRDTVESCDRHRPQRYVQGSNTTCSDACEIPSRRACQPMTIVAGVLMGRTAPSSRIPPARLFVKRGVSLNRSILTTSSGSETREKALAGTSSCMAARSAGVKLGSPQKGRVARPIKKDVVLSRRPLGTRFFGFG